MKRLSKQPTKIYLRDDDQFIIISPTKYGYEVIYSDNKIQNRFRIVEIVGGKVII